MAVLLDGCVQRYLKGAESVTEVKPVFRVACVERTGMRRLEERPGFARIVMPSAGKNHVEVMHLGAHTVLTEAVAAVPGILSLIPRDSSPTIKDI